MKERGGEFVYLALEKCERSLHEALEAREDLARPDVALGQIASGVRHLHRMRIVHRDLKPQNILLKTNANASTKQKEKKEGSGDEARVKSYAEYICKISDMGLGKMLLEGQSMGSAGLSVNQGSTTGAGAAGSLGWQAPEVMAMRGSHRACSNGADSVIKASKFSSDIFSLGCVFHYVLCGGSHLFGVWYEREANIMNNNTVELSALEKVDCVACDLVRGMVDPNPAMRPTAEAVCDHPYFWGKERKMRFLVELSNRLEKEGSMSSLALQIEADAFAMIGTDFTKTIDRGLFTDATKYRAYDQASVVDCLRFIRNKSSHRDSLPEEVTRRVGDLETYFERLFPSLILQCWKVCGLELAEEDPLAVKFGMFHGTEEVEAVEEEGEEEEEEGEEGQGKEEGGRGGVGMRGEEEEEEDEPLMATAAADVNNTEEFGKSHEEVDETTMEQEVELLSKVTKTSRSGCNADLRSITLWSGSEAAALAGSGERGWWRSEAEWEGWIEGSLRKDERGGQSNRRQGHLNKFEPKFRTRLCNNWIKSLGTACPMIKKGKCVFAHSPCELRVKRGKRNRWGKNVDSDGNCSNRNASGGEDSFSVAWDLERTRLKEGKWTWKDGGFEGGRIGKGHKKRNGT